MNRDERMAVGKMWLALAEMHGREISQPALSLMLDAVSDLDGNKILVAMKEWAKNSKHSRHPLPGDLRQSLDPAGDPDANAREAASRIIAAVSKYGYNNPKLAEKFIGELGWHVVSRFGGWMYVCENLGTTLDITSFQAQARDVAKATIVRGPEGITNAPALPKSDKITSLLHGNDMNKMLEKK